MDASRNGLPAAAGERHGQRVITLAVGFALLAACLAITLSHTAKRRLDTNGAPVEARFPLTGVVRPICQSGERIPSGTSSIRIALAGDGSTAPRVSLVLAERGAVRDAGGAGARWDRGTAIVPLAHPLRGDVNGSLCVRVAPETDYALRGALASAAGGATVGAARLPVRGHVEYLAAGGGSWWSFVPTIVRRMGLGHVWSGASVPLLAAVLVLTSIALGAWQLVRDDG